MRGLLCGRFSVLWRVRGEQDRTPSQRRAGVLQISEEGIWRGGREKKLHEREKNDITRNSMNVMEVWLDLQLDLASDWSVNNPMM